MLFLSLRLPRRLAALTLAAAGVAVTAGTAACPAAFAAVPQNAPNAGAAGAPAALTPEEALARLRAADWDPAVRGPLLAVLPVRPLHPVTPLPTTRVTLPTLASALEKRLVLAGRLTALVPRTMIVINTKPGTANPFAGLRAYETLKLLLASFSPAQWQQAGAESGIGAGDLTDDQRLLWTQMLPERATIQRSKVQPGDRPNSRRFTDSVLTETHPRSTGRLRISKAVDFTLSPLGGKGSSYGYYPYGNEPVGSTVYLEGDMADRPPGGVPNSAYGVPLLPVQPHRPKPGAVDFAAQGLDKPIPLTDFPPRLAPAPPAPAPSALAGLPTIEGLLRRISTATGREFVADRRVARFPVYLRGESARAGDILQALAESVSGTFRQMPPGDGNDTAPLYLLTDDVAGIGTRAAALAEWADAAGTVKRRLADEAIEAAAKNGPLAFLRFAPNDPGALLPAQAQRLETQWRTKKGGASLTLTAAEMSPGMRERVEQFARDRGNEGIALRTDTVRVSEILKASLLLPEFPETAIETPQLGALIARDYLRRIAGSGVTAPTPPTPAPSAAALAAPPLGFASPALQGQRRLLIARPADAAQAAQIVRAARGRGITDIWLETSLADPGAAAALLSAATRAGGGTEIAVGGLVRLLKDSGIGGEPDRNLLGETGAAFRDRRIAGLAKEKREKGFTVEMAAMAFSPYGGWVAPAPPYVAELRRRLNALAAVPDLAALAFRATTAPGWAGLDRIDLGDSLWLNGALGCTPGMRRAFLRERGIDPVDIPDTQRNLQEIDWNLNDFRKNEGSEYTDVNGTWTRQGGDVVPLVAWWEFRDKRNRALLSGLLESVRKTHPALPLYLSNRISGFSYTGSEWFGSWDPANLLPRTSLYTGEKETRAEARRMSRTIFASWRWAKGVPDDPSLPEAPAAFARQASALARESAPPLWDGVVLDLSEVPAVWVADLLTGLPAAKENGALH